MSGFSPDWLALREAADHRSRDAGLAERLAAYLKPVQRVRVVDIGCGTGSNLRATAPLLGQNQQWTLVDYDPKLLAAARTRLTEWADVADTAGDGIVLVKAGRRIDVRFRQADLNADLDSALGTEADLITASAFFDLASVAFIERFAQAVAQRRAPFFTVLTYNGEQSWSPADPDDDVLAACFHAHQQTDKGLAGVAAGPDAPDALAGAFVNLGYAVHEASTPWRLAAERDRRLLAELVPGFAGAVRETGAVPASVVDRWLGRPRAAALVGHTDTLALPPMR